jgi:archaellum component FlaC
MLRTLRAARGSAFVVVAVVALGLLAAGCGGKSSSSGTTSADDWANNLCSAISTWSTSVQSTTTSLKGNVTKESLDSASSDIAKSTNKFVDDLKGLGTPDTESGKKAKESLDTLAGQLDEDVKKIQDAVKDVSSTSGALQAISTVSSTLSTLSTQVTTAFTSIQQLDTKGELEKAFRSADSCKALSKQNS